MSEGRESPIPTSPGIDSSVPTGDARIAAGEIATPGDAAPAGQEPQVTEPVAAVRRRGAPRKQSASSRECPWCSARVPVVVSTCPACQATIVADPAADAIHLPGLTEVSPELRAYAERVRTGKPKRGLLSTVFSSPGASAAPAVLDPSEVAALRPPSEAVRAEMARIDAEIAAEVVSPGADPWAPPAPAASSGTALEPASPASSGGPAPDAAPPPTPRRRRTPPA